MIVELRQYTLHPGRRDELIELFEREFIAPQEAAGIAIDGTFRDADRPDMFVWLRSFPDMESRRRSLEEFYGGPVWRAHRDAANATMIDSDNVLLLRGERPPRFTDVVQARVYVFPDAAALAAYAGEANIPVWITEPSPNTFPRLPVRGESHAMLVFGVPRDERYLSQIMNLVPTQGTVSKSSK
ncbi:MAG: NIPSNAP family protein [Kofleriaceae bacterium]